MAANLESGRIVRALTVGIRAVRLPLCPIRRRMKARLGNRVVGLVEPFSWRSGSNAHRSPIPGFPGRRLKGFCTSIRVMNAVVESAPVHGGEYLLLLCMARYAADDGTRVFPSVATLAQDSRQNERTVQKQLRALESKGLIRRCGMSAHGTNNYTVVYTPRPTATPQVPKETSRGALERTTPVLRPSESSSNTSKNRQPPVDTPQVKPVRSYAVEAARKLLKDQTAFKETK